MDKSTDFNDGATVDLDAAEAPKETIAEAIKRLSALHPIEFDRVSKEEAKKLGCKASTLEAQVKKARASRAKQFERSEYKDMVTVECPDLDQQDPLVLIDNAIKGLGYGGDRKITPALIPMLHVAAALFQYG